MALPTHLQLNIVTPDRSLVDEQVDEVEIPGSGRLLRVLPGHTPLMARLGAGDLWCAAGVRSVQHLAIAFGFARGAAGPGDRSGAHCRAGPKTSTSPAPRLPGSARKSAFSVPPSTSTPSARESRC